MAKVKKTNQEESQTIILRNQRGHKETFGMLHALNLLRLQGVKKGWEIDGNEWQFKDNEIIRNSKAGDSKDS